MTPYRSQQSLYWWTARNLSLQSNVSRVSPYRPLGDLLGIRNMVGLHFIIARNSEMKAGAGAEYTSLIGGYRYWILEYDLGRCYCCQVEEARPFVSWLQAPGPQ